ncbi:hypothetical protein NLJ89_g11394 [Agrocybe chaxingu]|uniref:F-box domain-containing protein n=1 Tax=Agrocybe chaxingu TaxID=84603 RepID=A0A9W8MRN8_9AGAR|nr:hypothetical protein NLJ89_g11394 [Agrocybe chaxingu]
MRTIANELPFDVLSYVFKLLLPPHNQHNNDSGHPQRLQATAPMSLCRVCASWRHAALGMPSLWSWLTIPLTVWNLHRYQPWALDSEEIYIRRNIAELLDWCRRNAAHHPVHLRLELYQEHTGECIFDTEGNFIRGLNTNEEGYQPFKELFTSNTFQLIKDLDLALSPKAVGKALTLRINTRSPPVFEKVECLTLRAYATTGPPPNCATYSRFPSLRRVHLSGKQDIAHLPWDQLTHLCISYESRLTFWFSILTRCTNLEFTAIRIPQDSPPIPILFPPPTCPHLRHLTYWAQDTDLCVYFPGLRALRLVRDIKDASPIQGFSGLRRNLSCAKYITELHLNASIFHFLYSPGNGAFPYEEDAGPALNQTVPNTQILVIDSIDTNTESNWMEKDLIRLLESRWIQFSPMYRGRVEFVYNHTDQGQSGIGGRLLKYVEKYGSSLSYEVVFRIAPEGWNQFTAYELPKGLRGWDEAMGFYDNGQD